MKWHLKTKKYKIEFLFLMKKKKKRNIFWMVRESFITVVSISLFLFKIPILQFKNQTKPKIKKWRYLLWISLEKRLQADDLDPTFPLWFCKHSIDEVFTPQPVVVACFNWTRLVFNSIRPHKSRQPTRHCQFVIKGFPRNFYRYDTMTFRWNCKLHFKSTMFSWFLLFF